MGLSSIGKYPCGNNIFRGMDFAVPVTFQAIWLGETSNFGEKNSCSLQISYPFCWIEVLSHSTRNLLSPLLGEMFKSQ